MLPDIDSDTRLLSLVMQKRRGDAEAFDKIAKMLGPKIRAICSHFFLPGYEQEDIYQVALLALDQATKVYDDGFDNSFENFALKICITRRLKTLYTHSVRRKFQPLNNAISWDTPIVPDGEQEDSGQPIGDFIESEDSDPLVKLVNHETNRELRDALYYGLTELEANVLKLLEEDEQYRDIARMLDVKTKCVDNSLVRARKKTRKKFENCEDLSVEGIIDYHRKTLKELESEEEA